MKIKHLLFLALFAFVLTACNDDEESPSPVSGVEGGDYLPIAEGNKWEYGGTIGFSLEVTGETTDINGKTFAEAEVNQGGNTTTSFIRVEDGIYSSVGFLPNTQEIELVLLQDNVPEGTSWEETIVINGINTNYEFTVAEIGISHTVDGEEYDDVIRVRLVTSVEAFGFRQELASQDIYFALNVGIIQNDLGPLGTSDLVDFTLN